MLPDELLQINNLHVYFYLDEGILKAVDGVRLAIDRGQTLCLVGESGCGKTVTGLSILRLIPEPPGRIVAGEIRFAGQDLLKMNAAEVRRIRGNRIAMIFQEPMSSLNPSFTVGFQVAEPIRLHQRVSRKKARELSVMMLERVGLPDPERQFKQYPHELSGGMLQRVMIAMAQSCNPDLIVADEPTTALDVTIQAQILTLMNRLKQETGASMILITHDLGVVDEMADRVAVMYAGQIVEYSHQENAFRRPRHPYTLGLMNSIPRLDQPVPPDRLLKAIPGVVPSLLDLPEGCNFRNRCPQATGKCAHQPPPWVEIAPGHWVRCWQHE